MRSRREVLCIGYLAEQHLGPQQAALCFGDRAPRDKLDAGLSVVTIVSHCSVVLGEGDDMNVLAIEHNSDKGPWVGPFQLEMRFNQLRELGLNTRLMLKPQGLSRVGNGLARSLARKLTNTSTQPACDDMRVPGARHAGRDVWTRGEPHDFFVPRRKLRADCAVDGSLTV